MSISIYIYIHIDIYTHTRTQTQTQTQTQTHTPGHEGEQPLAKTLNQIDNLAAAAAALGVVTVPAAALDDVRAVGDDLASVPVPVPVPVCLLSTDKN